MKQLTPEQEAAIQIAFDVLQKQGETRAEAEKLRRLFPDIFAPDVWVEQRAHAPEFKQKFYVLRVNDHKARYVAWDGQSSLVHPLNELTARFISQSDAIAFCKTHGITYQELPE